MENHYQEYHHHQHAYHQPHLSNGNGRPSMPKKPGKCLAESSPNFSGGCEPYSNGKNSRQLISKQLESHLANHYQQPGPPPPSNRRFSFIGLDDLAQIEAMDKYSTGPEKHEKMCSSLMVGSQQKLSSNSSNYSSPIADGKATLSRKAQKIAQKAQKLSISAISSELSSSASALYSLFTDNQSANSTSLGHLYAAGSNGSSHNLMDGEWQMYLMDQTDAVSGHTQKGIEFLERFGQFVKERATIEEEYAQKLRNLVKKSKNKKNDEEECKIYSYMSAFYSILSELDSLAAQHEVVGEKMKKEIVPTVLEKAQVLRAGRKKHIQELQALNTSFNDQVENMAKLEKTYGKAFKDAQIAHVKYEKADKNYELSRLDVDRAKNNVHQKNQICEQAKQSYAHGLESANQAQHNYYNQSLPNLLEEMRKLDMSRIDTTKSAMLESVNAERSVSSIVQRCYSDMESAIATINPEKDTLVVVEQHRSGYALPADFRFNDLGCPSQMLGESMVDGATLKRNSGSNVAVSSVSRNSNGKGIPRKHSMHQRLFGGPSKSGSSNGANDAYSNLPPQQRCRKIQARLDDLAKEAATKEQSRAGLEKMFGVYKENPKLGNASDVDQQMKQYAKELEVIYAQVENYRRLLLEAQSELNTPMGGLQDTSSLRAQSSYNPSPSSSPRVPPPSVIGSSSIHSAAINNPRSSYSGESVSSGVSEGSSSTVPNVGAFARPQNTTSSSNGFHSISPKNHPPQQPPMQHIDSNSADFYEECDSPHQPASGPAATNGGEDLAPLGTCTAIYGFDGSTDGTTMEMREGDEMLLIEKDEGDGWTRVRHMNSQIEGFVPTSYLQCRWF